MKRLISLLLSLSLLLALMPAAADVDSSPYGISGTNASTTIFYVQANGYNAGVMLAGTMGQGTVSHGSSWARPGNWDEWLFGFFKVTVTGSTGTFTYTWVPSADAVKAAQHADWETETDLLLTFAAPGSYTVTVSSIVASDYLSDAYVRTWKQNAGWNVSEAWGCTPSRYNNGSYTTPKPTAAAGKASVLSIDTSYSSDGIVRGSITRYTTGVSHSIEWVHQNGQSFTENKGTATGSFISYMPAYWPAGYVYATLITSLNGREIGRSTGSIYLTGSRATATPALRASNITLQQTTAYPGVTVYAVVTRNTAGVTHSIVWNHQDGSSFTTSLGTRFGTISATIPSTWRPGTVTATLYTYSGTTLLGYESATMTILSKATATPAASASSLKLQQTSVTAGNTVSAVITRYTVGVTHTIVWTHQNGSSFTSDLGTRSGTVTAVIPAGWAAGQVTATLYTYYNGRLVGYTSAYLTVQSRATATPAAVASMLTLQQTNVTAGNNVSAVVTRYTNGVTHMIIWTHQDGSSFTTDLGTRSGTVTATIPEGWRAGQVTATLYTYLNNRLVGYNSAYLTVQSRATATPSAVASSLKLQQNSVTAGSNVTAVITRYTNGVTHSILWTHQNGSSFNTELGTRTGTVTATIPADWQSGSVTATLYTYFNGYYVGNSSQTLYVTVQPAGIPSEILLYNSQAVPGMTIGGYVNVYTSGVTHTLLWSHSRGQQTTTSWGNTSGSISFTVPYNWGNGNVTVTLTTYLNGRVLGTDSATFRISGPTPTPGPTKTPKPTATPADTTTIQQLQAGMIYPTGGYWESSASDETKGMLLELGDRYNKLIDFTRDTTHNYTLWDSQLKDDVPELRFTFDSVTMKSVWIRGGRKNADYYTYARPNKVTITVYCDQGVRTFNKTMSDSYSSGASGMQKIDFGEHFTGVYQVDIFVPSVKLGDEQKYKVHIADVAFEDF